MTLIRSLNVYDFEFSYEGLAFITEKQASETRLARVIVEPKDILLNITGASVARCCIVPEHLLPARVNQHVSLVRVDPNRVDSHYVLYCINSPVYKRQLLTLAQGGATREALTKEIIGNFEIPLPPLPTQRKIAAVLSAYDDLIENNTRRIKILEDMAQTIYREWFVHFRFPGHENVKMVESELGLIPEGWKVGRLGDIAESVRRNVKPSDVDQETPYLGLEHLPRKSIALSNWDIVDSINSSKLAFKKGEILFGKIRPYFHKVVVAPLDGICSSDTIVIRSKEPECFARTLACVFSEHFVEYATATSQGTKMPRADWKVLVKYPVMIPPKSISQRFSALVQDIVPQIHNLIFRNRNLRQTRDLLLPKLISGELDVSDLDIITN
ncbi:restriction endonuclease subunit S [Candidatus Poribacteria bacterium]|nr:restriction endonuclease subunit S [Candidatus Poribacteria bacterium]